MDHSTPENARMVKVPLSHMSMNESVLAVKERVSSAIR